MEANIIKIDRSIILMKSKKNTLVSDKIKIQEELSELKDKRLDTIDKHELETIYIERKVLKNDLHSIEIEMLEITHGIKSKNILKREIIEMERASAPKLNNSKILSELKSLMKEYRKFATDHTRINSMRMMASTFSDQLENLIKNNEFKGIS